jgi:hypothetical protein
MMTMTNPCIQYKSPDVTIKEEFTDEAEEEDDDRDDEKNSPDCYYFKFRKPPSMIPAWEFHVEHGPPTNRIIEKPMLVYTPDGKYRSLFLVSKFHVIITAKVTDTTLEQLWQLAEHNLKGTWRIPVPT